MKSVAVRLATALSLALALAQGSMQVQAQETQTVPGPVAPLPSQISPSQAASTQGASIQTVPVPSADTKQGAAPVERRLAYPDADSTEPVDGPLTEPQTGTGAAAQNAAAQAVDRPADAETIRVETRLVNVAVNVTNALGAPVGGLEQKDFQIFEDGRPQPIAFFDRDRSSPLSIVLAIDASETMVTRDRLEREAAKRFVGSILRPEDEISLMQFADTVREIVPFTNQPKRIEQGLGQVRQGDETALYKAVFLASQRLAATPVGAGRRRVLVVISDGSNSVAGMDYRQAVDEAERAGAIVYSVIIVPITADAGRDTGGEHTLIQMSEDTGGRYYYVVNPKNLDTAFRHISDDLRTQYLMGYYAPQKDGDSGFRRIAVKLTGAALGAKYTLRYRTGYFADAK